MQDPKLEQEIQCVDTCVATLKQYYDLVNNAIKQEVVTTDSEESFADVLKRMPDEVNAFYDAVDLEKPENRFDKFAAMTDSLHSVVQMPHFQQETLLNQWHAEFMDLFYYRGSLLYRQEQLQKLNLMQIQVKRMFQHPIMIIILLIVGTYLLLMAIL